MSDCEFEKPCEAIFERLSKEDPDRLVDWMKSGELIAVHLTFALEHLGKTEDLKYLSFIQEHLDHEHPLVVEGATIGLENLLEENLERVKKRDYLELKRRVDRLKNHSSEAIRFVVGEFAEEVMKSLEKLNE